MEERKGLGKVHDPELELWSPELPIIRAELPMIFSASMVYSVFEWITEADCLQQPLGLSVILS